MPPLYALPPPARQAGGGEGVKGDYCLMMGFYLLNNLTKENS